MSPFGRGWPIVADLIGFETLVFLIPGIKLNTSAASYFKRTTAVNDLGEVRQGDLLVMMHGNAAKQNPGHVMVVESVSEQCTADFPYGSIRVVESTDNKNANPRLSDSTYKIERIIPKGGHVPCMILITKRLGHSGFHVSVMRA